MRALAKAQPNIALIKYWGKRDIERNLPAVGSLSITLESLWTTMSVEFLPTLEQDRFSLNGTPCDALLSRVSRCLDRVAGDARDRAAVASECNFPIAAGLASSASAFAALALAASEAAGERLDAPSLARVAGSISGSAARSVFGGFVELSAGADDIEVRSLAAPEAWPLCVVVAVTALEPKPIASGDAMIRGAQSSPFYPRWIAQQTEDLKAARAAVASHDFARLAAVAEHNCLKMHSVMWTSRPPIVYWNSVTLACMQAVRALRANGHSVFFTIDAGPQVKAVCLPEHADTVAAALGDIDGVAQILISGLGPGARLLDGG